MAIWHTGDNICSRIWRALENDLGVINGIKQFTLVLAFAELVTFVEVKTRTTKEAGRCRIHISRRIKRVTHTKL